MSKGTYFDTFVDLLSDIFFYRSIKKFLQENYYIKERN